MKILNDNDIIRLPLNVKDPIMQDTFTIEMPETQLMEFQQSIANAVALPVNMLFGYNDNKSKQVTQAVESPTIAIDFSEDLCQRVKNYFKNELSVVKIETDFFIARTPSIDEETKDKVLVIQKSKNRRGEIPGLIVTDEFGIENKLNNSKGINMDYFPDISTLANITPENIKAVQQVSSATKHDFDNITWKPDVKEFNVTKLSLQGVVDYSDGKTSIVPIEPTKTIDQIFYNHCSEFGFHVFSKSGTRHWDKQLELINMDSGYHIFTAIGNWCDSFKNLFGKEVDIPKLPGEKNYINRLSIISHILFLGAFADVKSIPGVRIIGESNVDFINRNQDLINCIQEIESDPTITIAQAINKFIEFKTKRNQINKKEEVVHHLTQPEDSQARRHNPFIHPELVGINEFRGMNTLGGHWNGKR